MLTRLRISFELILCLMNQQLEAIEKTNTLVNILTATKLVLYTVLEFLNTDDLVNLHAILKATKKNEYSNLEAIIQSYLYICQHMNQTDRSYYYLAYQNTSFRRFQKLNIQYLVQSTTKFKQLSYFRQKNFKFLVEILAKANCVQVANQIQQASNDPQIPMLRLLRQTVGIGCTSTFQNFLASLGQDVYSMPPEEYPNLSEFYQMRSNQAYINQFFKIGHSKGKSVHFSKIKRVRFAPYLIRYNNRKDFELQGNQRHNFIVNLFAIADQMVQASATYIEAIEDPFYKLLQFCLRYSLYRNFVLTIEEKFSFIFQQYGNLYDETFQSQNFQVPKFSFWKPSMSKWLLYMSKFHHECTQIYNYFILNKRYQHLNEVIQGIDEKDRVDQYAIVRNRIKSINIQDFIKLEKEFNKEIYQIIQSQIIYCINQFGDEQLDMSLDEVTVHWTGHTKQKIGYPFEQFQQKAIYYNNLFYDQVLKSKCKVQMIETILEADLKYINQNQFYKGKIFVKILQIAQEKLKKLSNNQLELSIKFQNMDQEITLYNEHAKIPEYIQNAQSRQFYQILPRPEQQISKYIQKSTMQSMNMSDESLEQEIQYYSEEQNQICSFQQNQSMVENMGSFMEDQICSLSQNYYNQKVVKHNQMQDL